jgi:uncharacterized protein YjfI (DUF2170 family)
MVVCSAFPIPTNNTAAPDEFEKSLLVTRKILTDDEIGLQTFEGAKILFRA